MVPPAREVVNDIVSLVSYYLQDNIDRPISLRELSRHVGFSIGHLNCLYKKATGTTVHRAIINKRLEYGCRYLKRTDRQVKDIAAMVGYEDVNYFYLQFRKKYHMTPSEYRRKHHPGES